jgi:hypothetical protein
LRTSADDQRQLVKARNIRITDVHHKKRRSGIPTGNAGEYFVRGELLRRGYDAQLADRNTKGYDLLVGRPGTTTVMRKVQVKSVRAAPWYVNQRSFQGDAARQVTVYVLIGPESALKPVRYFIAKNRDVAKYVHKPPGWNNSAFLRMKAVEAYEVKEKGWNAILG